MTLTAVAFGLLVAEAAESFEVWFFVEQPNSR